jgi:hypothetical protein
MRVFLWSIITLTALLSGCRSPVIPEEFQPANNETVANVMGAGVFMGQLREKGAITCIPTNGHGQLTMVPRFDLPPKAAYPFVLMFQARLNDEPTNVYWFSVSRTNAEAEWRVDKSWTTDERGNPLVPDLQLPSDTDQKVANQATKQWAESPDTKREMQRRSGDVESSWVGRLRAQDLVEKGRYEEALRLTETRIGTHPNDPFAHFLKGRAHYLKGEWAQAIASLQRAEEIMPSWERHYTGPLVKAAKKKRDADRLSNQVPENIGTNAPNSQY